MMRLTVQPGTALRGRIRVPGDKSISHRALLLGALAKGASQVSGFLPSGDCLATLACLRALGVKVEVHDPTALTIHGRGLRGLRVPRVPLNCARSGTTMRLLAGILAGQPFESTLTGEEQLLRRPMGRIAEPLRRMGADIETVDGHARSLSVGDGCRAMTTSSASLVPRSRVRCCWPGCTQTDQPLSASRDLPAIIPS